MIKSEVYSFFTAFASRFQVKEKFLETSMCSSVPILCVPLRKIYQDTAGKAGLSNEKYYFSNNYIANIPGPPLPVVASLLGFTSCIFFESHNESKNSPLSIVIHGLRRGIF